jgi:hypothetical protein
VPFFSSLLIHTAVILLAVALYKPIKSLITVSKEQDIIPDAEFVEGANGGIPNPGLGDDPNRKAAQDQIPDAPADSTGWSSSRRETLTNSLMGGGSGDSASESAIALGPGGIGKGNGTGSATGAGVGSGDGAGQIGVFGLAGGGNGLGPQGAFMGIPGGNATRIAYVCDASGSMVDKMDLLKVELRKSVEGLKPVQSFSIYFFRDEVATSTGTTMLIANPANKRKAFGMLEEVGSHGGTNPLGALKQAFAARPQLIYLLTDGDFENQGTQISNDIVVSEIKKLNAERKVKINTIAFISHGDEQEKVLKQIARDNGGIFKYVSTEDLNAQQQP